VLDPWAPVEAETRDAYYRELDRQDIALLARRIVAKRGGLPPPITIIIGSIMAKG
jgi:hypothetical protein